MAASKAHFYRPEGLVRITGPDASTYLQGQFSNDLSNTTQGSVVYGLWLNVKGKIQADSFVLRESDDSFLAISYACPSERLVELIEAHIIMDDVEVCELGEPFFGISLWGEAIDSLLSRFELEHPEVGLYCSNGDAIAFQGRRDSSRNVEFLLFGATAKESLKDAEGIAHELSIRILDEFDLSRIALESGKFLVNRDILQSDLPQEVGLDEDAISYSKGCYIGQEVMARLKSMGRARRALKTLNLSSKPEEEAPFLILDQKGKKVGEIRRVVETDDSVLGLAMVNVSADLASVSNLATV